MLGLAAVVDQAVRGAGGVGAHQDLDRLDVLGRDLRERQVEHRDDDRRRCSRRRSPAAAAPPSASRVSIGVGQQRVKPVAALVVAGRPLLLRVRGDQRRVDVDRQPLRRAVQLPEPLARPRVRRAQRLQQRRVGRDPVDHPKRRRVRRDRPEQRLADRGPRRDRTRTRRRADRSPGRTVRRRPP